MKAYYYNNFNTGCEKQIVIINESQIESKKLCETYDDFGQQCGCYAAGCYSIDNCECTSKICNLNFNSSLVRLSYVANVIINFIM